MTLEGRGAHLRRFEAGPGALKRATSELKSELNSKVLTCQLDAIRPIRGEGQLPSIHEEPARHAKQVAEALDVLSCVKIVLCGPGKSPESLDINSALLTEWNGLVSKPDGHHLDASIVDLGNGLSEAFFSA